MKPTLRILLVTLLLPLTCLQTIEGSQSASASKGSYAPLIAGFGFLGSAAAFGTWKHLAKKLKQQKAYDDALSSCITIDATLTKLESGNFSEQEEAVQKLDELNQKEQDKRSPFFHYYTDNRNWLQPHEAGTHDCSPKSCWFKNAIHELRARTGKPEKFRPLENPPFQTRSRTQRAQKIATALAITSGCCFAVGLTALAFSVNK